MWLCQAVLLLYNRRLPTALDHIPQLHFGILQAPVILLMNKD